MDVGCSAFLSKRVYGYWWVFDRKTRSEESHEACLCLDGFRWNWGSRGCSWRLASRESLVSRVIGRNRTIFCLAWWKTASNLI